MRPKDIGTLAETAVVSYLRANGWPSCERRALAGAADLGDVVGCPALCWEVKSGRAAETASDGQVNLWLAETERERRNAQADIGVLVMKRAGYGAARVGDWWAVLPLLDLAMLMAETGGYAQLANSMPVRLRLADLVVLLRAGGYGDPLEEAAA